MSTRNRFLSIYDQEVFSGTWMDPRHLDESMVFNITYQYLRRPFKSFEQQISLAFQLPTSSMISQIRRILMPLSASVSRGTRARCELIHSVYCQMWYSFNELSGNFVKHAKPEDWECTKKCPFDESLIDICARIFISMGS